MYIRRNFNNYADNIRHHHTKCSHLAKETPKICNVWGGYNTYCSGPKIMYGSVLGTMKLSWRKFCYAMENYMVDVRKLPAFCMAANEPSTQDIWKYDYRLSTWPQTGYEVFISSLKKRRSTRKRKKPWTRNKPLRLYPTHVLLTTF